MTISQYVAAYIYNMIKNSPDITDLVGDRIHWMHEDTKKNNWEDIFPMITYTEYTDSIGEATKRTFFYQISPRGKTSFDIMGLKDILINIFNGYKPESGGVIDYISVDSTNHLADDLAIGYAIRINIITRDTGQMSLLLS